jgi:glycosyltransferase involved in cell wall biosynthesis
MKVSVVIVSYNQAEYLEETILSVVNQEYPQKEIILIDGGSNDGSIQIIQKYANNFSYWISEPDEGQTDAIIKGFNLCTGELITWLNSDDLLIENIIDIVANFAKKMSNPEGVFYGGVYFIDSTGEIQEKYPNHKFNYFISKTLRPVLSQPGTFFSRKAYFAIGGLTKALKYSMDNDLFCNFLFSGYPFFYTGKYHSMFRKHPTQKGHSLRYIEQCALETKYIQNKYGYDNISLFKKKLARILQVIIKLLIGCYLRTLLYRIIYKKRFFQFDTTNTN